MNTKHDILSQLHELVFKQHIKVNTSFISKTFNVHISESQKLLEKFVKQHRKDDNLKLEFCISGSNDCEEGGLIRLQRFSIVGESELDSTKSEYTKCTSAIYSVIVADPEPKPVLNFLQFAVEPSVENVHKLQSLSYINNPNIKIRPQYRALAKTTSTTRTNGASKSASTSKQKPIKSGKYNVIKQEIKPEPMDVDDCVSFRAANKRSSKEGSKQRKRIKVLEDSSDEEDEEEESEDVLMKENLDKYSVPEEAFKVTKLEAAPETKPDKQPLKGDVKALQARGKGMGKGKGKAQPSITSFFKKA